MNSYELIETYPGSPGLGTIVVDTNINNGAKDGYFSENWGKPNGGSAFKIGIQHDCENSPKFWKKIENKKLLTKDTVKEGQKVYRIWRNGEKSLGVITKPDFMMFEALEDYPSEGQITKGYNYGLGDYKYELVEEVIKKPIFKTFDGVDIFEGDRVYSVTPNFCIGYSGSLKYKPIQPCFSTKEKAEEYIFYNSPVLSLKEVGEIYLTAKEKGSKAYTLVRQKLNL